MREVLRYVFAFWLVNLVLFPLQAYACDPCSLYYATKLHGFEEHPAFFGISEIYTNYDNTNESKSLRNGELTKHYSTTQFALSYDIQPGLAVRANYPLIARSFDTVRNFQDESDSEVEFGDASLHVSYAPLLVTALDSTRYMDFSLGIKLPTGDTDSLGEPIVEEPLKTQAEENYPRLQHHTGGGLGVQGRGLSIGTGSFDYIFGTKVFLREKNFFAYGSVEYFLRTEGDDDYEFGDEVVWNFGPAWYVYLGDHDFTTALRLVASGEHKQDDERKGRNQKDTGTKQFYIGPELLFTLYGRYTAELGLDVPMLDSSEPTEAEFRARASIGYRF